MGGMLGFFVLFCLVFYLVVDRKQGTKKCMMYAFVGEILPSLINYIWKQVLIKREMNENFKTVPYHTISMIS